MANREELEDVKIKHEIFQDDSLSPLLLVLSMALLTTSLNKTNYGHELAKKGVKKSYLFYIDDFKLLRKTKAKLDSLLKSTKELSKDIWMKFSIHKCATIAIKAVKIGEHDECNLTMKI